MYACMHVCMHVQHRDRDRNRNVVLDLDIDLDYERANMYRRGRYVHNSSRIDKRHLEVNLCKLWLTVTASAFVTVAPGKLKVSVDTTC